MPLRMVELVVPEEATAELPQIRQKLTVLGAWHEPLHEGKALLRVLAHSDYTEAVINELQGRYQGQADFRLVIFEVEATLPEPEPDQSDHRHDAGQGAEDKQADADRIAVAELVQKLTEQCSLSRVYLLTLVLSAIVAAIGLMRNNVAVVIGAMVIAPLLSPNITLAVATTLGDLKLARQALKVSAVGLGVSIAFAVLVGLAVSRVSGPLVITGQAEITSRTVVGLSDVALALAAGCAGALAFTTGLSSALVGVMVAVALMPPLVASGLLAGAGQWSDAGRAALLLLTNIICINLAGVGTFLYQGIRPRHWWEAERARRMIRLAAGVWLGLLAALVVLILLLA